MAVAYYWMIDLLWSLLHRRTCAWCLQEKHQAMGEGSHGICPRHADMVLAEHRALIARREAKKAAMP